VFLISLIVICNSARPKGWYITPLGLAHESCIHRVPSGTEAKKINGEMHIVTPGGDVQKLPRCQYSIQNTYKKGHNSTKVSGFEDGWQVWTTFQSPSSSGFSGFLGLFTIPDAPQIGDNGQVLFMFTGLQNENWIPGPNAPPAPQDFEIIQPVLQWGESAGGGGNYWTLASWYVTVYNGFLISDLIPVNSGDTIFGNMTLISDSKWYISGRAMGAQKDTTLIAQKSNLKINPWAYCTLEVYDSSGSCGEYPDNPQVYSNLQLYQGKWQRILPKWTANATPAPICGQAVTIEDPTHVTIHFSSGK